MFAINPPNTPIITTSGRMDPAWYRFFSQIQKLVGGDEIGALQRGPYLTFDEAANLTNAKVLSTTSPLALAVGDGAVISLLESGISPDTYGSASQVTAITFDEFGRATAAAEFDLDTDNILEGTNNLFFTVARARESLSAGDGINYDDTTGEISAKSAGAAPSFTPYPGATISNPPTQAEVQAISDGLEAAASALSDLIALLQANGNLT